MEMKELKQQILNSGLKFNYLAKKAEVSPQRLSMCLNEKRSLPSEAISIIKSLLPPTKS
jgi:plasmid maintenance system antidote protein VapI